MKRIPLTILALMITAPALAETYTIDPNHTLPLFEINHLGFTTQRGRFDKAEGAITLDLTKKTGSVTLTIDANSIDMGQAKWNDHLKSEDFFHTEKFPSITFQSDRLIFAGDKPVAAEGVLTLLGVAKPVKASIQHFICAENPINKKPLCAADIEASLKRSEFGMNKYLPAVSDEVKVLVPVEAYLN